MLGEYEAHTAAPARSSPSNDALNTGLAKVIDSIIAIVTEETLALKSNKPFDLTTNNMRKARLLHDYNATARAIDPSLLKPAVRDKLQHMRKALDQNLRQFDAHAKALREVVAIVMEAAQERHRDGTYSAVKRY